VIAELTVAVLWVILNSLNDGNAAKKIFFSRCSAFVHDDPGYAPICARSSRDLARVKFM